MLNLLSFYLTEIPPCLFLIWFSLAGSFFFWCCLEKRVNSNLSLNCSGAERWGLGGGGEGQGQDKEGAVGVCRKFSADSVWLAHFFDAVSVWVSEFVMNGL